MTNSSSLGVNQEVFRDAVNQQSGVLKSSYTDNAFPEVNRAGVFRPMGTTRDRAFMFLDLKSSTHLAEKLEHVSYSRLVQDCYAELTVPLIQYNAEVYQYVGDEVVLTWRMSESFMHSRRDSKQKENISFQTMA